MKKENSLRRPIAAGIVEIKGLGCALLLAGVCIRAAAGDADPRLIEDLAAPQTQSPYAVSAGSSIQDAFSRALVEEESGQDLAAAIRGYRQVIAGLDANRQMEATALFHLGECYRKEGKTNEAVVQYRRVLADFSDQHVLVSLSRANLKSLGAPASSFASADANHAVKAPSIEPDPLVEWSFAQKDGDLVPDLSGHGYDARIHGHPELVTRTGENKALEFDGSGNNAYWSGGTQDCGMSIDKRLQRGFTELSVEAWIRKTSGWWMPIVNRDLWDKPYGFGLYAEWSSGKATFGHYDHAVCSKTTVQDGRWHHLVGTMQNVPGQGYVYRIYVDGELDAEMTDTWGVDETSSGDGILKVAYPNVTGGDQPYHGAIGNIAIFDVALTPAQVKARFEASRE